MTIIADILLLAGALGAAVYCHLLSKRLRNFTALEGGVGNAVAILSTQVDELSRALEETKSVTTNSERELRQRIEKADAVSRRLELLIASMHDIEAPKTRLFK